MVRTKNVFWQALIFTLFIFSGGIFFGFYLENLRTEKSQIEMLNSESSLLDLQIDSELLLKENIGCEEYKRNLFDFTDKIYSQVVKMEKYDSSNKFKKILSASHKKYDLMRLSTWQKSIEYKSKCNETEINTVIYLFEYGTEDLQKKAIQTTYSRVLMDLKSEYPDKILLLPIAANLNIYSVETIKNKYGVERTPAVIINERKVFDKEIILLEELRDEIK